MDHYDPNKPSTYIQYLDANNLYGCAMSQPLPTHGFKWLKDLTVDSVINLLERRKTNKGYIFEVDLEYPSKLWKSHNDYPLAPEKTLVNGVEKLIGSFKPRKKLCRTLSQSQNVSRDGNETDCCSQRNNRLSISLDGKVHNEKYRT